MSHFNELFVLDLFGNPCNDEENYRQKVFKAIRNLKVLDQEDKEGNFNQGEMKEALQRIPSNILEK